MTTINLLKKLSMATAGAAFITVGTSLSGIMISTAQAATLTNGFTFSVANSRGISNGTHFHSNTGGSFGNPAGKAEVGSFNGAEDVRGLSEYNIAGLTTGSAFVTFDVFRAGGLFGQNPFIGNIDVVAYAGNNAENISDFQATSLGTIGTFNTAGLTVGDKISFNISSIFNNFVANSIPSLGIRLQATSGANAGGAWVFDNGRLTSSDESKNPTSVPEPSSALGLFALSTLGVCSLKRKHQQKVTVKA